MKNTHRSIGKLLLVFAFIGATLANAHAQCTSGDNSGSETLPGNIYWTGISQTFVPCAGTKLLSLELFHNGAPNEDVVYFIGITGPGVNIPQRNFVANNGAILLDYSSADHVLQAGASYTISLFLSGTSNNRYTFLYSSDESSYADGSLSISEVSNSPVPANVSGDLYFVVSSEPNEDPTDIQLDVTSINENNSTGAFADLSTIDPDIDDTNTHTYALSGPDAASFGIFDFSGDYYLSATEVFDYETKNSYSLTITSTDQYGGSYSEDFTISVNNVNEEVILNSPLQDQVYTLNFIEDVDLSGVFSDVDGDPLTYTASSSNTNAVGVSISGSTLTVFDNEISSYGTADITVIANDGNGLSASDEFTITLANRAPTDISMSSTSVDENTPFQATLSSTDADASDTHNYSISGTDAAFFSINDDQLISVNTFDFEARANYTITLTTNDGEDTFDKGFTISVNDVNEEPYDIYFARTGQTTQRTNIVENNAIGDLVDEFITLDEDTGENHSYSLSGIDAASFTIDGNQLKAAEVFDFETKNLFNITITTSDQNGLSYSEDFSVDIFDGKDFGPNQLSAYFSFTNGDLTDEINNILASGAETTGSGKDQILLAPTLANDRFETADNALEFSTDRSLRVYDEPFYFYADNTINLWFYMNGDVPAGEQTLISSSGQTSVPSGITVRLTSDEKLRVLVYEEVLGATMNEVSTNDITTNEWHMLTVVTDFTNGNISAYIDKAMYIQGVPTALGYPSQWFFGNNPQLNNEFMGRLDDIAFYEKVLNTSEVESIFFEGGYTGNQPPTDIILSDNGVEEALAVGTVVGTLGSVDSNDGDTHTYSLAGPDAASFTVEGIELKTAEVFDWESKSKYEISITTDDGNGGTFSKDFTIEVSPTFVAPAQLCNISQNSSNATLNRGSTDPVRQTFKPCATGAVKSVTFYVPGTVPPSMTVSLAGQTKTINPSTGANTFTFDIAPNVTAGTSYPIRITASGNYSLALTNFDNYADGAAQTFVGGVGYADAQGDLRFRLEIIEGNNSPTNVSLSTSLIGDGSVPGDVLATISATDADANDLHIFDVYGTDAAAFTIDANKLIANETFDMSVKSSYSIFISADDRKGGTINRPFSLTVGQKMDQSITFNSLAEKTFGDASFELSATASSGLTVSYISSNTSVATISGNTVSIIGAGTASITATQPGNDDYNAAPAVSQTLIVNKADQQITIQSIADKLTDAANFEVIANTSSALNLSYAIVSGPAAISGNEISLTGQIGVVQVEVSQSGNSNYLAASALTSFEVYEDLCAGFSAVATELQSISCNGAESGSFEVNVTSGTAPFSYTMNGNEQATGLYESLAAGTYELVVEDANGCSTAVSITLAEPDPISVTADIQENNSINGAASISLTVSGGTGTYSYSWSNGATTADINGLFAGTYEVTVADGQGCSITESFTVGGVTASKETLRSIKRVYPNPVSNRLVVEHGAEVRKLRLLDMKGAVLETVEVFGTETELKLASLPNGLYLIQTDKGQSVKIIKKD